MRKIFPVNAIACRSFQKGIVDVGDVLNEIYLSTCSPEISIYKIEG
jgi:hypothetical protein